MPKVAPRSGLEYWYGQGMVEPHDLLGLIPTRVRQMLEDLIEIWETEWDESEDGWFDVPNVLLKSYDWTKVEIVAYLACLVAKRFIAVNNDGRVRRVRIRFQTILNAIFRQAAGAVRTY